ncbi:MULTISPECIES: alpha-1,2-fucosyltransferase [unclassified Spirosoma]|uniref:alpha-1,2-fucosyltransferase n=1 Tax=unclassified Spirosoma TaxID=2621999 RepID=UPI00096A1E90|nr:MULTISPECIES: alpha-1,2-fucosyltransferase [unclassified Spirosoma]MBN8824531.1 alpha-1,2-fucosyltransferase [Spirosoma sp.]OJW70898.1 MAG: hypothetical protein BGO59_32245 [Spirosoma sp. 48-14]
MVISILAGGLGNQLFQYAFGFSLARQLNTELRLDRHLLESQWLAKLRNYTPRTYELDAFAIAQQSASLYDVARTIGGSLLPGRRAVILRETNSMPLLTFGAPIQDVLCLGYWQSEDYFKTVANALRQQLTFQKPLSDQTRLVADAIVDHPAATFVHIRRGDYVTNTNASQHHGLCGKLYYQQAVNYIRERVPNAGFFVFSDDQSWVKRELGDLFPSATYVEHNSGIDSWQDMYLMQLCRHAIVANSSFSWWGAWLNPATDRFVVAPRQWFVNQSKQIIPSHWHSI